MSQEEGENRESCNWRELLRFLKRGTKGNAGSSVWLCWKQGQKDIERYREWDWGKTDLILISLLSLANLPDSEDN